jgi:hypothetical protein
MREPEGPPGERMREPEGLQGERKPEGARRASGR